MPIPRFSKAEILGRMSSSPRREIWDEEGRGAGWTHMMCLYRDALGHFERKGKDGMGLPGRRETMPNGRVVFQSSKDLEIFLWEVLYRAAPAIVGEYLECVYRESTMNESQEGSLVQGPWVDGNPKS